MQMVAVKPITRWQIWLGKWLGIMSLNAALLALSGASIYGLLQWRATKLPEAEQRILRNEVLVSRASAKPPAFEKEMDEATDQQLKATLEKTKAGAVDAKLLRQQIKEQIKAELQVVGPAMGRPERRSKMPLWHGQCSSPRSGRGMTAHDRCVHLWLYATSVASARRTSTHGSCSVG